MGRTSKFNTGVVYDVLQQVPTRHPLRNEVEGIGSDTEQGEDVWVCQVFPHYSLFAESLRDLLMVSREGDGVNAP